MANNQTYNTDWSGGYYKGNCRQVTLDTAWKDFGMDEWKKDRIESALNGENPTKNIINYQSGGLNVTKSNIF